MPQKPEKDAEEAADGGRHDAPKGFLNLLLMLWMYPIVWKGFWSPLKSNDIPSIRDKLSARMSERAEILWDLELSSARANGKKPSLERVFKTIYQMELWAGYFAATMQGLLMTVGRPLVVRHIINVTQESDAMLMEMIVPVICVALLLLLEGMCAVQAKHLLGDHAGLGTIACLSALIQRKSLRLGVERESDVQESTLIGADLVRLFENMKQISHFPMSIASLLGGTFVIIWSIGIPGIVGLAVMAAILLLNRKFAGSIATAEGKSLAAADKRLALLKQVIENMKSIKLSAWEEQFEEAIDEARKQECTQIMTFRALQMTSIQIGRAAPILSCASSFIYLALSGEAMVAADMYAALNVFMALRMALIMLPLCISLLAQSRVQLGRVQDYLTLDDTRLQTVIKNDALEGALLKVESSSTGKADGSIAPFSNASDACHSPAVDFVRATLRWRSTDFSLREIDFRPRRGQLTAVVGTVGSGKSSLLQAMLGEMQVTRGTLRINRQSAIGFVPQHSFVMCGTVQENVLMSRGLDHARLEWAIKQASMQRDLELFTNGMQTEIGERGVTLSGGQQQRMSIARALYADPTLLLADDPLSAVDGKVANHIFQGAFRDWVDEKKEERMCVMVVNQAHFLPYFDHIVMMVGGRIQSQGTYEELITARSDSPFCTLVAGQGRQTQEERGEPLEVREFTVVEAEVDEAEVLSLPQAQLVADVKALNADEGVEGLSAAGVGPERLVKAEVETTGMVKSSVWAEYCAGYGHGLMALSVLVVALSYVGMASVDWWLTRWIDATDRHQIDVEGAAANTAAANAADAAGAVDVIDVGEGVDNELYAMVYALLSLLFLVLLICSASLFSWGSMRASLSLHQQTVSRLVKAPIQWYESTPSGRITSRLSSDLSIVDIQLGFFFDNLMQFTFTLLVICIVVIAIVPLVAPFVFLGMFAYAANVVAVDRSNREAKRMSNAAMAPILSTITECINGRTQLRVMAESEFMSHRFNSHVDEFSRQNFFSGSVINWGMFISYVVSSIVSALTAIFIFMNKDEYSAAFVGLALTYSFLVPYFLLHYSFIISMFKVRPYFLLHY
jgi:ABC-type multidrug transport system fused ATPase/permease subunit